MAYLEFIFLQNCKVEEVEVLKAIPITECKQQKYEMCHDEACPWVIFWQCT